MPSTHKNRHEFASLMLLRLDPATEEFGSTPHGTLSIFLSSAGLSASAFAARYRRRRRLGHGRGRGTFDLDLRVTLDRRRRADPPDFGVRDDANHYLRTLPRFETAAPKCAFLNRLLAVGIGEIGPGGRFTPSRRFFETQPRNTIRIMMTSHRLQFTRDRAASSSSALRHWPHRPVVKTAKVSLYRSAITLAKPVAAGAFILPPSAGAAGRGPHRCSVTCRRFVCRPRSSRRPTPTSKEVYRQPQPEQEQGIGNGAWGAGSASIPFFSRAVRAGLRSGWTNSGHEAIDLCDRSPGKGQGLGPAACTR